MTENNSQTTRGRSAGRRIALIVTGAVAGVLAFGALALGAGVTALLARSRPD